MAEAAERREEDSDGSMASSTQTEMEGGKERDGATQTLTLAAMHAIAADIKATLSATIAEEVRGLTHRLDTVERDGARRGTAIAQLQETSSRFTTHLIHINRHLEDLDNRGRRNNIRVRGLPETILPDKLDGAVRSIFNNLLNREAGAKLVFDRIHRALRPRPQEAEGPPRDVICCIQRYPLKDAIMAKARGQEQILFNGEEVQLYQDLSPITLKNRRALRPLTTILTERHIQYRWRFPFGLAVTKEGQNALLRVPDDLPFFCEILQIEPPPLPEWYEEFRIPDEQSEAQQQKPQTPTQMTPGRKRGPYTPRWKGRQRYRDDYRSPRRPRYRY